VDGLNSIADALRWFEDLPTPIRDTAVALGLVAGPAALAAGGFLLLAPRAIETWDALSRMGRAGEMAQTGLTKVGKGLARVAAYAGVAVLLGEIGDGLRNIIYSSDDADRLANMFTTMGESADFATQKLHSFALFWESDGITGAEVLERFGEAMDDAFSDDFLDKANRFGDTLTGWMPGVTTASERLVESMAEIDQAVAQLAQSGNTQAAATAFRAFWEQASAQGYSIDQVLEAFPEYESFLVNLATQAGIAANEQNLLNLALGQMPTPLLDIEGRLGEMAGALVEAYQAEQDLTNETNLLQEAAEEAAASHERLVASLLKMVDNAFNAEQAAIDWQKALADLNATIKENGENTDLSTEAGRNNRQALLDLAKQALATAEANLANGDSLFQVKKDMELAREAFIKGALQMGYTKAEANELADQLGLTDENVNTLSASIERIPSKHVNVTVGGVEAATANVQTLQRTIDGVKGKTVTVTVNWAERGRRPGRYLDHVGVATGGYMRDVLGFAGGGWPRRAGLIQGPGGPTDDLVPARLSRDEFVTRAAAVKKAGVDAMYAINSGRFSRSALRAALGLADGGTPWAPAMPSATTQVPAVASAGPTFNITNVYPQAEPTSRTVQRASQHQAAAGRY
ncbi:MAG TPA: hypothetical protein VK045_10865, partial [Ornithinicoccus sp.]|nr:hypothetical protein [Ornithinicoccus sp.]